MLRIRGCSFALALAPVVMALSGCGVEAAHDAGHDASRYDVVAADRPLLEDAPQDVSWAWDVAPTVDVTAFDATAGTDTASARDASTADGHAGDAASACMALADAYASAVRAAQTCSSRADCSAVVCETLCCNCRVYVNPAAASASTLDGFASRWRAAGCDTAAVCTPTACDPPASAECSMGGRCTTIRSAGASG